MANVSLPSKYINSYDLFSLQLALRFSSLPAWSKLSISTCTNWDCKSNHRKVVTFERYNNIGLPISSFSLLEYDFESAHQSSTQIQIVSQKVSIATQKAIKRARMDQLTAVSSHKAAVLLPQRYFSQKNGLTSISIKHKQYLLVFLLLISTYMTVLNGVIYYYITAAIKHDGYYILFYLFTNI